jgi:F-type H+-transporting ATPase subunit delta
MIVGSVARRYARAIFAVAEEEHTLEQTADELRLLGALGADPDIAAALANPLLSTTARRGLAGTIADNLKLSSTTRNFVSLLADHRRLDHIVGIAQAFAHILDQKLQRVRATITSAVALSDAQRQELVAAFERKLGRTVLAEASVDPQLLGGVVVDVDGTVYDGSVHTQLQALANRIAGGRSLL